jgi:ubiquinone/menaquinone biosynthesis C-methylase UbiE
MATQRPFATALAHGVATRLGQALSAFQEADSRWRSALIEDIAPRRHDVILDAACGSGALAVALAQAAPGAIVMGLDHRPEALVQARARADAAKVRLELIEAYARDISFYVNELAPTRVICTFSNTQDDLIARRTVLTAAREALRAGGTLHAIDIDTRLHRFLAQSPPQAEPAGRSQSLPDLMRQAGFSGVVALGLFAGTNGAVRLHRGALATPS